jgi:lipoprotein-releasing system permease protein
VSAAEHSGRRPGLAAGAVVGVAVVGLQAAVSAAGPALVGDAGSGIVAQSIGGCLATLCLLLGGLGLGAVTRLGPGDLRGRLARAPWGALGGLVLSSFVLGLIGVVLSDEVEALGPGHVGLAMAAVDAAVLPAGLLGGVGAVLGANAQRRSWAAAGLALVALLGLQTAGGQLAVRVSYDPKVIEIVALSATLGAFLVVGFGLAVGLRRLAFVELVLTALGFGYVLYLVASTIGRPLLASSNVPKEQILVGLAFAPSILAACLLAVGSSVGFLLTGGGRFDARFGLEAQIARRYLRAHVRPRDVVDGLWALIRLRPLFGLLRLAGRGHPTGMQSGNPVGSIMVISVAGVSLGVMALVVVLSVMSGFEDDLKTKILGAHAHVVVQKKGDDFVEYAELERRLADARGVRSAAAFVMGEGMVSSESGLSGVIVKGIEPGNTAAVRYLEETMEVGRLDALEDPDKVPPVRSFRLPPPSGANGAVTGTAGFALDGGSLSTRGPDPGGKKLPGVVIGRELARTLRVRLGETVNLVSPTSEEIGPTGPQPKLRRFRVVGIFFSGMYEYDSKFAYVQMEQAQRFFGMRKKATGIELRVLDVDDTPMIVEELKRRVGGHPYGVRDWREMNKELFSALLLEKLAMFIILTFIVLVASFNIVSTLVMIVLEKGREIAILKSMGASEASIMKVFVVQGLVVGVGGALLGLSLGVGICLFIARFGLPLDPDVFYIDRLPVVMSAAEIATIGVAAVLITYLATIYPAMAAAELRPVEGLRDD